MLIRVVLAVDSAMRHRLESVLGDAEILAVDSRRPARLWERLKNEDIDLVVVSSALLGKPAETWVRSIRNLPDDPEVIVLSSREDAAERAELLAAGAMAVLHRDLPEPILAETLRALLDRRRQDAMRRLAGARPEERYSLADFVSSSPAMQRFVAVARRVVASDSSLLILGETGVGKERLARSIHGESPRSRGPFLAVNCGALPESLLESELFGHEEGAFTGATRSHRGYFELAHGGTLFLDEVGEMPVHLQVKLLRVLEDRRVQRVGGERSIPVDVRVMTATNKDLEAELRGRRFRADLYYRLAVVTLTVPPLRERREDIPVLVQSYLEHFAVHLGRGIAGIRPDALGTLVAHAWPGNVRELINVVERAVLLCSGSEIGIADLPSRITGERPPAEGDAPQAGMPVRDVEALAGRPLRDARREVVDAFERAYLETLLRRTGGRIGETAALAGITPRSLYELMQRHGLRKEAFRPPGPA